MPLPLSSTDKIIAPYWIDVDTRGTGDIYYRQTTNPSLLARTTSEIRAAFPISQNATITNLLIVTWDRVGYFYWQNNKVCMYTQSVILCCPLLLICYCYCLFTVRKSCIYYSICSNNLRNSEVSILFHSEVMVIMNHKFACLIFNVRVTFYTLLFISEIQ